MVEWSTGMEEWSTGMEEWSTGMEYWNGLGQDLCTCMQSKVLYMDRVDWYYMIN